jgi:hypothetical protein
MVSGKDTGNCALVIIESSTKLRVRLRLRFNTLDTDVQLTGRVDKSGFLNFQS